MHVFIFYTFDAEHRICSMSAYLSQAVQPQMCKSSIACKIRVLKWQLEGLPTEFALAPACVRMHHNILVGKYWHCAFLFSFIVSLVVAHATSSVALLISRCAAI